MQPGGTIPARKIAAGMRSFLYQTGFLLFFQKKNYEETPFKIVAHGSGGNKQQQQHHPQRRQEITDVVDTTLTHYSPTSTTPLNIGDALMLVAMDDIIHLDCVYFVTRRQPHTIIDMLRHHYHHHHHHHHQGSTAVVRSPMG